MYYSDELLRSSPILRELNETALRISWVEGNVAYQHPLSQVDAPFEPAFFEKRYNLYQLALTAKCAFEIGVNAGHSALIMLLANPKLPLALFDLRIHEYTEPCFQVLKKHFPQITMRYGPSHITVPQYQLEHPTKKFDLIHIDGSHEAPEVEADMYNARLLAAAHADVIFDDTHPIGPLRRFIDKKAEAGLIKKLDRPSLGLKDTVEHELFQFI